MLLQGTGQSGTARLTPAFAGELFGAGQPLDASRYYIILPDGIGHGKSSKPSDGMKTAFPKYNYDDMVDAHYRLVTEGLCIKRLRLVMGNSMGGMHTLDLGREIPRGDGWAGADGAAEHDGGAQLDPHDPQRSRLQRRAHGQPRMVKCAIAAYGFASNGGTLAYQAQAPTADKADKMVTDRLAVAITADANDYVYSRSRRATTTPLPASRGSRCRCWRPTRRTTSAIRPRPV